MQAFYKEGKLVKGYRWSDFLHGYVYARFVYDYIAIGTGQHRLSRFYFSFIRILDRVKKWINPGKDEPDSIQFADTYHGKVVPLAAAKQLVTVQEDIRLENLEKVVPYKLARDIILQEPQHLGVLDCPCRSAKEHPCLPLDVCIIVGEPFVGMMTEIPGKRFRRITQQEALTILDLEDQRGHVHHAFFKDAMLGRFYAICNCCSCCCGAMQSQKTGSNMLAASGFLAVVDDELCIGCGICEQACPFDAIEVINSTGQIQYSKCMGCGICVSQCTQSAISLSREPSKGIPLELDMLLNEYQSLPQN